MKYSLPPSLGLGRLQERSSMDLLPTSKKPVTSHSRNSALITVQGPPDRGNPSGVLPIYFGRGGPEDRGLRGSARAWLTVYAYSPLGRGLLTGEIRTFNLGHTTSCRKLTLLMPQRKAPMISRKVTFAGSFRDTPRRISRMYSK
jgi:hypothetical protein